MAPSRPRGGAAVVPPPVRPSPPEDPLSTPDPAPAAFTELDARRLGRVRRFFALHPRASDVLVCVFFALSAISSVGPVVDGAGPNVGFAADTVVLSGAAAALSLALTALALVALWFRRRWPVRVTIALGASAVLQVLLTGSVGAGDVAFALGLYVVAATRPQRQGWLLLGAATVGVLGAFFLWGAVLRPDGARLNVDIGSILVAGLVALAVGANVRGRRLHTRALVERHQQLVDAGEQHAKLAAAAEQTRIAREMHDVVAHGLTVMIALSDGARVAMRRSPDDAAAALDLLSETGRSALADMRRMLGVLRGADVPLEPQPGTQDLESLVQQFRAAGLTVHLTTAGPALPADAALALTVYRVVQESLTNALRHAGPGARVDVLVRHGAGRVGIEVVDDGAAADPVADAAGETGRLGRLGERLAVRGDDPLAARTRRRGRHRGHPRDTGARRPRPGRHARARGGLPWLRRGRAVPWRLAGARRAAHRGRP
ncbi:sensor histidine kinase [Cellulomonas sp. Y8]|uniref:sensor histidine kinase n=1 Tax=Cellulomonas sp. Y8 TaxID=2591145 RepID=UPI0011CBA11A|nr:histidine kinase [Cellulomonas sp. Y8]